MSAAEDRGVQVEARTLSGAHLGMTVTAKARTKFARMEEDHRYVMRVAAQERAEARRWLDENVDDHYRDLGLARPRIDPPRIPQLRRNGIARRDEGWRRE